MQDIDKDGPTEASTPSANQAFFTAKMSWLPTVLIWIFLSGWLLCRVAIPAVNEPHYLSKAAHWWNPQWCAGDFFLESSNPHLVYYATFGALTQFFSFELTAILCRIIGMLIVAVGWQRMCTALTGNYWSGILALPVFMALQCMANLSGEWLFDGTESKVPAYGFLFWAIGEFVSNRFVRSSMFFGFAVSFHPIVGIWGIIASIMACVSSYILTRTDFFGTKDAPFPLAAISKRTLVLSITVGLICALPGLIPALLALTSDNPEASRIANRLQVGYRLAHHLDPTKFPKTVYIFLTIIWVLLSRDVPNSHQPSRWRLWWWRGFIFSAIIIAGVGVILGTGPRPIALMPGVDWRCALLKFYPFRLADLFVPIAVSIAVTQAGLVWLRSNPTIPAIRVTVYSIFVGSLLIALLHPIPATNPSRLSKQGKDDWISTCKWIEQNTDPSSTLYSLDSGWAIKWYAKRPEYVNYKDMPQDAKSIVEWNNRLWTISNWRGAAMADGKVTPSELEELRKSTGIDYLIAGEFGPIELDPVFQQGIYRVYRLP
ncbi:DUF6798 domain-containing protein [Planctomicrobium sp. SH527]|uniref:DUF6798 domain-containing protein n=1 Tax=Planctomicrobium sp. SH527 TaxID=3448123 RepID=UPI003F5B20A2